MIISESGLTLYQRDVLRYARRRGQRGFTDVELSRNATTAGSTYRTRRNELTTLRLIVDTGRVKMHLPSARKHRIWAIAKGLTVRP